MMPRKIFLATSGQLAADRLAFELMIGRLDQQWRAPGQAFDVVLWKNFVDALSAQGLQKEQDKAAADCDLFVMMFFTKLGPYTLQEFGAALVNTPALPATKLRAMPAPTRASWAMAATTASPS